MNKKAFSLVELIVWIVISMILMTWVWILVSWWITNIVMQDKIIQNTGDFREFSKDSLWLFSRINTRLEPVWITSTSALVRVYKDYDKLWVSYIGEVTKDWFYCTWTDVDSTITKHILIKNFLPFEEIGENIFDNYSKTLYSEANWFKSFYKSHIVKDNSNHIIIWKFWVFWTKLWDNWLDTYLNNPTWLAYDSTNNLLYIADTGNNRILAYNLSTQEIYKLLDEKDWLNEPIGLAFNDEVLYITNSWNWEILEYSSKNHTNNPDLILTWITQNSINKFEIEFLSWTINLTNPDSINDFTFTPNVKNSNDFVKINDSDKNKLKYYFISSLQSESHQSDCTAWNQWKYVVNASDVPIKCSSTEVWTWQLANLNNISFNDQKIEITDIKPNFTDSKSYYVKLNLYNNNTLKYENYFPYFTKWDDDLTTRENNTLKIISNDFKYPTWIEYDSTNNKLKINDFWDRKEYWLTLVWVKDSWINIWAWNWNFDYTKIPENKKLNYFLNTPIENLDISYDISKKYLNIQLDYYKQYNCYNTDEKVVRSMILGKSFK